MDAQTESRLLRLAIAKGLLTWEDLDAICGEDGDVERAVDGSPLGGRFVQSLVAGGKLDLADVLELIAEHERTREELTPDLAAGAAATASWTGHWTGDLRWLKSWQRYKIERFLGAGGMGSVYLAFDPKLGRHVALKFLNRNDPEQSARFLREARAQARLDHPHVCQIYEAGEVEGRPYIAMQHIEGRSLSELKGALAPREVVRILADVARAVHAAHRTGLIHRDLKPGNILVAKGEHGEHHPFVVDFGLARDQEAETGLTQTGLINGTPAYVSPEQAQGEPLDARSDLYSLGVVLYELLGGKPPLVGANPAMTLVAIVQEEPKPLSKLAPETPGDLETLVMKCLEKSPARRYDSARALAEDLERYLDGEPILARPSGWAYRLGKRLRKNRPLAAVTAAAVLGLLILGALVLHTHLQSREREELARRFGQRVSDLENRLRLESYVPRHDISGRKAELKKEKREIEREMDHLGDVAQGPGHYALGRIDLLLGQHETARAHLEKAWRAGWQSPEVAAALGRAMGILYEKALVESSRSKEGRGDAGEGLTRHYQQPALHYLKEGASAQSSPYITGLIALYEGHYADAVRHARQALAEEPWFYEAAQLEADVYATQADDANLSGDYESARTLYARAQVLYDQLLTKVPSEAALEASACGIAVRRAVMEQTVNPAPGDAESDGVLLHCDRALAIDPGLADAYRHRARFLWNRADGRMKRGVDPELDLALAVAAAHGAIARDRKDAASYGSLAHAARLLGSWRAERGRDPGPSFRQAIEASRKAVEQQPELATHHNALGTVYLAVAQYEQERGIDPRANLEKATASYHRAVEQDPRHLASWINLGTAWKVMAEVTAEHGLDPATPLAQALEAFQHAVKVNPRSPQAQNNLGNSYLTLAEYELNAGHDPRQDLDRAAAAYRQAADLKPDYPLPHFNLACTFRMRAEADLERGQDPAASAAIAEAALREAVRLNPSDADSYLEDGRLALVMARWRVRKGEDPHATLGRADSALEKARTLNPGAAEVHLAAAQVERTRAGWLLTHNADARPAMATGLVAVGRALEINPKTAEALALQGALEELAARLIVDPAKRRETLTRAATALRQALALNPLLKREYSPILAKVEAGLASGALAL